MQLPDFKYYLRKKITAVSYVYYYVNTSGVVTTTGTPTEIEFAPDGWMDKSLEWKRGFEWWGVFTTMSQPLRFVKDGAQILRDVYFRQGVQGNCELYIEKLNRSTMLYELYYRGEVDFSKILDENNHVTANIMDGSYTETLKAREDTDYEIDIDFYFC